MNIVTSTRTYERWLTEQLGDDLVKDDIVAKHEKMAADPFQFLRATYWRWAETILDVCPQLKDAPRVLAVGDIHVENYGTWRDSEGRLVWGVNDFDEAAKMPYALDLVRLAASAVLAHVRGITPASICTNVLNGYREGLGDPKPYVLDRHHQWLRDIVVVDEAERKHFWKKFDPKKIAKKEQKAGATPGREPGPRYVKALESARPNEDIVLVYRPRVAGTGSLGRPRFVGIGEWQGDLIVREAKALLRSGWTLSQGGSHKLHCEELASGKYRSPDPWYRVYGHTLVRRLSPNDYKIEAKPKTRAADDDPHKSVKPAELVNGQMLHAMGHELATLHRGTAHRRSEVQDDLDRRGNGWLLQAVRAAAKSINTEWRQWRAYHQKSQRARRKPAR